MTTLHAVLCFMRLHEYQPLNEMSPLEVIAFYNRYACLPEDVVCCKHCGLRRVYNGEVLR